MPNGNGGANGAASQPPVNLAFTKFLFITPRRDDDAAGTRMRGAGATLARGFFNSFEADPSREGQPHETIQFLVADGDRHGLSGLSAARYAVQVSGKYRPRLHEVEAELRRRVGDTADVHSIDGAERAPRYTSSELYDFAYRGAMPRVSGRIARNALVLPISKTAEWWAKPSLERHAYFYPHIDSGTGIPVHGHARSAQEGISTVFRRLYHNPDGYARADEFDFVTYFECEDGHLETFERVHRALRDTARNPEWRYVREGPLWRGRRVLKW
jgi:hypothetical protein